jgi:hypothetical protein
LLSVEHCGTWNMPRINASRELRIATGGRDSPP